MADQKKPKKKQMTIGEAFMGGLRQTGRDIKKALTPKSNPTKDAAVRKKIRGALPRPPLTAKDLADIASGQNKEVIMSRRRAINKGIQGRLKHGGKR